MQLVTRIDTFFKPSAADSSTLPREQMAFVSRGSEFPVRAYRLEAGHIVATIHPDDYDLKTLHSSGRNTWWIFQGAVEDPAGHGPLNRPNDTAPMQPSIGRGAPFTMPGYSQTFYSGDPITPRSPAFTWAEALHFSGANYRKPDNAEQVKAIMRAAEGMQAVREKLNNRPIRINSWLRPAAINRAVGGAPKSTHLLGLGIDFAVAGLTPSQVYAALDSWHGAAGGLAQGGRMGFTHIDWRGNARARWSYPGA
jgi:hypothetical protein